MPKRCTPRLLALVLILSLSATPAFAVNKDMVQLQTQIQQLQDAVARLQQSNDERMGVLKDLVQQNADSVNKMSVTMEALQKQLANQQTAGGAKVEQVSGQVQALNDSLDEMKARMARLEKVMNNVESQQGSMAAALANLPSAGGAPASPLSPASSTLPPAPSALAPANDAPLTVPRKAGKPSAATVAEAPSAQPVEDLYRSAYSDYMAAKYPLATSEFGDVTRSYPDAPLAGNAFFYLGEIEYRAGHYAAAAKQYDRVLEQFPDNNKIPASHLHKGEALLQLKQTEAGVRELRALIQRFPSSPEATQARTKLSGLGVPVRARAGTN